jgi:hypothetical protein
MPMWDAGQAVDREAHNEYLSSIDEAFGVCLQGVETARDVFESNLESARVALEVAQAQAAATHGRAIDAAWAGYKQQVASSASTARAREIAESRSRYLETSAEARRALEEAKVAARDTYSRSVHEARVAFEAAVESEFAAHRETLTAAGKYLEGMKGGHIKAQADTGMTDLPAPETYFAAEEPVGAETYLESGPFAAAPVTAEPFEAESAPAHEAPPEPQVYTAVFDEDEDDVILEGINPD